MYVNEGARFSAVARFSHVLQVKFFLVKDLGWKC